MPGAGNLVETLPEQPDDRRPLRFSDAQRDRLREYVSCEVEDAFSSQAGHDAMIRDCLRMYDAQPAQATKDVPIPNAPNIEVPLGAIAADAISSTAIDTIFQVSPVVTARPTSGDYVPHAKAMQRFINWGVDNEWSLRYALNHAILDDCQLGTGVLYIPWIEERRTTLASQRIVRSSPRIRAVPCEDFLVPGSSPVELNEARWAARRQYLTPVELTARAVLQKWDIDGAMTTAAVGQVRERRERLARTKQSGEAERNLVEVIEGYFTFDIDNDGYAEDLLVTFDRSSRRIFRVVPNPFERAWPFEAMVYQARPHLFKGIGVIEMCRAFETEASEMHNQRSLNQMLANTRMWGVAEAYYQEGMEVWPGKVVPLGNPKNDLVPLQMADVYPSSAEAEMLVLQYAERRTGVGDLARGRGQQMGSRTPGITALSAIQNINQRFTPAFDQMRMAAGGAIRQCVYRYQERIRMGDRVAINKIMRVLGADDGALVVQMLRAEDFEDGLAVELTASSASVNRDADRQNSILLLQFLGSYYEKLLGLMQIVINPGAPPELRLVAQKIVDASAEAVDRTIRTFDTVRDPSTFVIRMQDVMDGMQPTVTPAETQNLMQTVAQNPQLVQPPVGPNGAAAPAAPAGANGANGAGGLGL